VQSQHRSLKSVEDRKEDRELYQRWTGRCGKCREGEEREYKVR
jgi:hypothetical protein